MPDLPQSRSAENQVSSLSYLTPSVTTSPKDLITSVFEVIFSVFNGAIDMVSGLVTGLVNSVIGLVQMTLHTAGNLLEAAGGVGKFVASESSTLFRPKFKVLTMDVSRQYSCHWNYCWRYLRLSAVSRSSRPSRQGWKQEIELGFK